ncbi:MAG TPA: CPBP family intramembrane metalloprotease [Anaerolineae bacterium]|nr:CPBP family intramembrane metalloprotease [Anaerolineae bacterium]
MATSPSKLAGFLNRHAVIAFFLLATVLGGGVTVLVVQGILPSNLALVSALSALISGIILTAIVDGRAGLKRLLARYLIWRVGIGAWLFAFVFILPALLLGSLANPLFGGDPLILHSFAPPFPLLPMFLVFFLVAGVGEDLGWTGFLIPRLQIRYNALISSLIRGVLWGLWHMPLWFCARSDPVSLRDFPYGSWIAQRGFWFSIAVFFVLFVIPWSIIYSWLFNNTRGSLLLVSLLHGSEIWAAFLMVGAGIDPLNLANYWGYGVVLFGVSILLVLTSGVEHLSRKHSRIIHS